MTSIYSLGGGSLQKKNGLHLTKITILSCPKLIGSSVPNHLLEAQFIKTIILQTTASHISNTAAVMKDSYSHLQYNNHSNLKASRGTCSSACHNGVLHRDSASQASGVSMVEGGQFLPSLPQP